MATVDRTRGPDADVRGSISEGRWGRAGGRLLLTRREAAAALGMSLSHFQRHVQPFVPCVYSGQLRLYRPVDLERWSEGAVSVPGRR
jgi:hypothetical protein